MPPVTVNTLLAGMTHHHSVTHHHSMLHHHSMSLGASRAGEAASEGLTEALLAHGFEIDRLKTGTPARVDSHSVDFTHLEAQPGDEQVKWFSFDEEVYHEEFLAC